MTALAQLIEFRRASSITRYIRRLFAGGLPWCAGSNEHMQHLKHNAVEPIRNTKSLVLLDWSPGYFAAEPREACVGRPNPV